MFLESVFRRLRNELVTIFVICRRKRRRIILRLPGLIDADRASARRTPTLCFGICLVAHYCIEANNHPV